MLVHRKVNPTLNSPVPIYTSGRREPLGELVYCPRKQHNLLDEGLKPDRSIRRRAHYMTMRPPGIHFLQRKVRPVLFHFGVPDFAILAEKTFTKSRSICLVKNGFNKTQPSSPHYIWNSTLLYKIQNTGILIPCVWLKKKSAKPEKKFTRGIIH